MWILLKESATSSLCSDIFIAWYSFCAKLSTLVNGIPIISSIHSKIHHSKWQLICWVGVQELIIQYVRVIRKNKWRLSVSNKQPNHNIFCENTNTRQILINLLDHIVPWITHKIQTILQFLIMIYKCEFYLRNPQIHLYALISLLHVIPSAQHCLPSWMAFQSSQLYTLIHHSKWQLAFWVGVHYST